MTCMMLAYELSFFCFFEDSSKAARGFFFEGEDEAAFSHMSRVSFPRLTSDFDPEAACLEDDSLNGEPFFDIDDEHANHDLETSIFEACS